MNSDANNKFSDLNVMVVEDNAFTSIVIRKMLKSLSISQIETVSDGRQALDKVATFLPDVLLLDLRMPVMGGVELLSLLADQKFVGNVILMSGVEEDTLFSVEQIARENNISILGSLQKPANAKDLEKDRKSVV